jgi:hypothetical protein
MYESDVKSHKIWYQNLKGQDHFEHPGIGGSIILQWVLKIQRWKVWPAFVWLRIGTVADLLGTW